MAQNLREHWPWILYVIDYVSMYVEYINSFIKRAFYRYLEYVLLMMKVSLSKYVHRVHEV